MQDMNNCVNLNIVFSILTFNEIVQDNAKVPLKLTITASSPFVEKTNSTEIIITGLN